MSRLGKTMKALGLLLKDPWKLNLILNQNEEWEKKVTADYGIRALKVVPLQFFMKTEISIEPYAYLDGGSLPTDLALLKLLAAETKDCSYFEIGTWRGESAAAVADSARICYTLNLPDEDLLKFRNNPDFIASQRLYSRNLPNVRHIFGNSAGFDYASLAQQFDVVFIDGDHHYESILHDTRSVLGFLCHEKTVVVWHDYGWNPELIRFETLAAILDACPQSLHPYLYHVENTNCAILYKKDLPAKTFRQYEVPDHSFSVSLKIIPAKSQGQ